MGQHSLKIITDVMQKYSQRYLLIGEDCILWNVPYGSRKFTSFASTQISFLRFLSPLFWSCIKKTSLILCKTNNKTCTRKQFPSSKKHRHRRRILNNTIIISTGKEFANQRKPSLPTKSFVGRNVVVNGGHLEHKYYKKHIDQKEFPPINISTELVRSKLQFVIHS